MDQFYNAAASAIQQSVNANNQWSAEQAQKQMDFQREMSNTAHQREIADLKAAGLNPVLSAKLGGASTPSGAMASGDTSGTSALVDLLQMAMETAHSAASAASSAASSALSGSGKTNSNSLWLERNGYSAYHMSQEDADKIHSWLGDGSKQEATYDAAVDTISGFFSKIFGKAAGSAVDSAFDAIKPEFDPVKRGEAEVDRYNANAAGTRAIVESVKQFLAPFVASAKGFAGDVKSKVFYPRKSSYSVTYNGDGKVKGSSVWHAGGGSSKRVATLK